MVIDMKVITNKTFDEERALYDSHDIVVRDCVLTVLLTARARSRSVAILP